MTIGSTRGKAWIEALPTERGAHFTGRTFSRFHFVGRSGEPAVGEIWATGEHAVEAHAHESDELFYVLSGAIEIDGRLLRENEVAFIPRGTAYAARVASPEGGRVLRIELPSDGLRSDSPEYGGRVWTGPLTEDGVPRIEGP
ncbi:MAG TPA: cupin domain-containing protein [Thermoanaerobaculia bacterium]|jgi:mannose-6-phosphate isomerase-like protein (cupin superfamily)